MFKVESPIVLDPYPGPDVTAPQIYRYVMSRDADLGPVPVPKKYDNNGWTLDEYVRSFASQAVWCAQFYQIPVSGFVGQIFHETKVLRYGNDVHPDQLNFGGIGAVGGGVPGHSFPTLSIGLRVNAEHLLVYALGTDDKWPRNLRKRHDPRYQAVIDAGWDGTSPNWSGLAGKWAEHIGTYKKGIERHANAVISMDSSPLDDEEGPVLNIAIAAGHHNSQGGNPVEISVVDDITERMFYHFNRTPGISCRSLTPDGPDEDDLPGDGHVDLTIYAQWSQTLAQWAKEGWVPDLCIEEHTQGVGNTSVRGFFGIYPDTGDDVDVDVRDRLIPQVCNWVKDKTPLPIWTDGVMSERETGVGAQGHRLGYFSATSYLRTSAERVLFENGAHTNKDDLALLRRPEVVDQLCQAKVAAICEYYGIEYKWHNAPPVDVDPPKDHATIDFPQTGKVLDYHPFINRWHELAAHNFNYKHVGMPITNRFEVRFPDSTSRVVQVFEKDIWSHDKSVEGEWAVQSVNLLERSYILSFAGMVGIDFWGE